MPVITSLKIEKAKARSDDHWEIDLKRFHFNGKYSG